MPVYSFNEWLIDLQKLGEEHDQWINPDVEKYKKYYDAGWSTFVTLVNYPFSNESRASLEDAAITLEKRQRAAIEAFKKRSKSNLSYATEQSLMAALIAWHFYDDGLV